MAQLYDEPMGPKRFAQIPQSIDAAALRVMARHGLTWNGLVRVAIIDYLESKHNLTFPELFASQGGQANAVRKVRLRKAGGARSKPVRQARRGRG